jgi:hypothetical protein
MEAVFSVRSVPRLYNEDQLPSKKGFLGTVKWSGVGGWREMATSLEGLQLIRVLKTWARKQPHKGGVEVGGWNTLFADWLLLSWRSGKWGRFLRLNHHPHFHLLQVIDTYLLYLLCGLSPQANYTDRATAACRRSYCQLLRIEGATWSAWQIPTTVFSDF